MMHNQDEFSDHRSFLQNLALARSELLGAALTSAHRRRRALILGVPVLIAVAVAGVQHYLGY